MGEESVGTRGSEIRSGRLSALVTGTIARARMVAVPYHLGEVMVGEDPFNGRREGVVAVKNGSSVGLESAGRLFFYDYRQLRRPE